MPTYYTRAEYQGYLDKRWLGEQRTPTMAVISCGFCATQWERERGEGRSSTVTDRVTAMEHVRSEHREQVRAGSAAPAQPPERGNAATFENRGPLYDVPVTVKVSAYQLSCILISAIEGGINYWCPKQRLRHPDFVDAFDPIEDLAPADYQQPDRVVIACERPEQSWDDFITRNVALGGTLTCYECDEDTDVLTPHVLTREKLLTGLGQAIARQAIIMRGADEDDWDIDASGADSIIQLALLGEVRYG